VVERRDRRPASRRVKWLRRSNYHGSPLRSSTANRSEQLLPHQLGRKVSGQCRRAVLRASVLRLDPRGAVEFRARNRGLPPSGAVVVRSPWPDRSRSTTHRDEGSAPAGGVGRSVATAATPTQAPLTFAAINT
jgi:hypothetical protein